LPYKEVPAELREMIDELQQNGDYLVVENEQRQPLACLTPLPDADKARREEGARQLNAFLDSLPPSPYSEEETNRLIEEAIAAIRRQDREQQAVS
jgi:hypothetical protein